MLAANVGAHRRCSPTYTADALSTADTRHGAATAPATHLQQSRLHTASVLHVHTDAGFRLVGSVCGTVVLST